MRACEFLTESKQTPAEAWINHVYDQFQDWPYGRGDKVMVLGSGDDQQFAVFALKPKLGKPNTVDVDWFQAHPQRQGVGLRAMQELQRLASKAGIQLTLMPWDKGQVSQAALKKFYRRAGFKPIAQGATSMQWSPEQGVNEAFDRPYPITWEQSDADESVDALARLPDGSNLSIMFNQDYDDEGQGIYSVEFWRDNSQEVTGAGDSQRVFATVLAAIAQFIEKRKPEQLYFSANKDVEPGQKAGTRSNLYTSLVRRYANIWGYEADISDFAGSTTYKLHRLYEQSSVEENFADGRVKGKSRPGRVKRAGASCKGSVTDLRARARKYGGEKGKMYHWCANMKAGKKKAK